jgi:hypothetical protein
MVRFDNGARDGQSHAHAFRFAGVERLEDLFQFVFGNAGPRSDTDSSANFPTREVRMLMMRFSLGVSLIASLNNGHAGPAAASPKSAKTRLALASLSGTKCSFNKRCPI